MKRLILLLLFLSLAVNAAEETIEPDKTIGAVDQWTNTGGADKVISVTDDVDNNYIYEQTDEQKQQFGNTDVGDIGPGDIIDSVKTFWRGQDNGSGNNRVRIHQYVGVNSNDGSNQALTTSWQDYEDNFPLAPSGGAWDIDAIDSLIIEFHCTAIGAIRQVRVTKAFHIVYYTPAAVSGGIRRSRLLKEH